MDDPRSLSFHASDGTRLHALAWGDSSRRPLVLLHGAGAHAHWWDHLAPELAESFHVVALDFRGHGESASPEEMRAGRFREDLEAMLAFLEEPRAIVVGASLGAHVAMEYAARQGDGGPAAIALIDPARGGSRRARRRAHLAMLLQRSSPNEAHAIARFRFLPPAEHVSGELRDAIAKQSVQRLPDGRFGFKLDARVLGSPLLERPELGRIACPALLIRGEESPLLDEDGARSVCEQIPHCELVTISSAGHHVTLDRPDEALGALRAFLSGFEG
jgi:pimeloyl-ACP methyl ester carboxylesterase